MSVNFNFLKDRNNFKKFFIIYFTAGFIFGLYFYLCSWIYFINYIMIFCIITIILSFLLAIKLKDIAPVSDNLVKYNLILMIGISLIWDINIIFGFYFPKSVFFSPITAGFETFIFTFIFILYIKFKKIEVE